MDFGRTSVGTAEHSWGQQGTGDRVSLICPPGLALGGSGKQIPSPSCFQLCLVRALFACKGRREVGVHELVCSALLYSG